MVTIKAVGPDGKEYPVRLETITIYPPLPTVKSKAKHGINNPCSPRQPRNVTVLVGLVGEVGRHVPIRITCAVGHRSEGIDAAILLRNRGYLNICLNGDPAQLPPQDELVAPLFAADLTGRALAALGQLKKITEAADRFHVEQIRGWRKRQAKGDTVPTWGYWCEWAITVGKVALTVLYAPGLHRGDHIETRDRIELHPREGEPLIYFVEDRSPGSLTDYVAALARDWLKPKRKGKKKPDPEEED